MELRTQVDPPEVMELRMQVEPSGIVVVGTQVEPRAIRDSGCGSQVNHLKQIRHDASFDRAKG